MAQRSGLTRGDRRRNSRIEALRAVVRPDRAVLAIDLGEDKQVAALIDHDCRILGRRVVGAKAHQLGGLLAWAGELAARRGFAGVVVACEPTGHRWRAVMGLADAAGMGFVCVQSLRVHLEREADDYTRDKTDLLTELERQVGVWGRQEPTAASTLSGHDRICVRGSGPVTVGDRGVRVVRAHG